MGAGHPPPAHHEMVVILPTAFTQTQATMATNAPCISGEPAASQVGLTAFTNAHHAEEQRQKAHLAYVAAEKACVAAKEWADLARKAYVAAEKKAELAAETAATVAYRFYKGHEASATKRKTSQATASKRKASEASAETFETSASKRKAFEASAGKRKASEQGKKYPKAWGVSREVTREDIEECYGKDLTPEDQQLIQSELEGKCAVYLGIANFMGLVDLVKECIDHLAGKKGYTNSMRKELRDQLAKLLINPDAQTSLPSEFMIRLRDAMRAATETYPLPEPYNSIPGFGYVEGHEGNNIESIVSQLRDMKEPQITKEMIYLACGEEDKIWEYTPKQDINEEETPVAKSLSLDLPDIDELEYWKECREDPMCI